MRQKERVNEPKAYSDFARGMITTKPHFQQVCDIEIIVQRWVFTEHPRYLNRSDIENDNTYTTAGFLVPKSFELHSIQFAEHESFSQANIERPLTSSDRLYLYIYIFIQGGSHNKRLQDISEIGRSDDFSFFFVTFNKDFWDFFFSVSMINFNISYMESCTESKCSIKEYFGYFLSTIRWVEGTASILFVSITASIANFKKKNITFA